MESPSLGVPCGVLRNLALGQDRSACRGATAARQLTAQRWLNAGMRLNFEAVLALSQISN